MIGLLERVGVLFDASNGDELYLQECILQGILHEKRVLKHAPPELKNNKEFVIEVVKLNGTALKYASAGLKSDKDVVLKAVKQYGGHFSMHQRI